MSEPSNPYEAQKSTLAVSGDLGLASPWIRLGAAIIDGIVLWPVNYVFGMLLFSSPSLTEIAEAAQKGPAAVEALMPGRGMIILAQILTVVVYIAINYVFLKKGQSIGKMALKLQIQNRNDGSLLPVNDLILRRVLPFYGAGAILSAVHPMLGLIMLVDVLCIFRPGRNTLHDDLANTKVVKLPG